MRQFRVAVLVSTCLAVGLFAGAPIAGAYGNSGPAKQTFQITVSANCNNPAVCGADGLGGFWGWAVLYSDGTGEAELTGCGHLTGGGGPGTAGAGHFHNDFTYDLSNTTEFVTLSEIQTFLGHGQPVTQTVPGSDTGIPLVPGHHSTAELMGFTAPGVTFQVQVTAMH